MRIPWLRRSTPFMALINCFSYKSLVQAWGIALYLAVCETGVCTIKGRNKVSELYYGPSDSDRNTQICVHAVVWPEKSE